VLTLVDIAAAPTIFALTGRTMPRTRANHERFVMRMKSIPNGFLQGGFLTVAGAVFPDPTMVARGASD